MDNSRRNGRSLQYEPLESREMMAVVTGALKDGVLKITGTKYADTVNFAQVSGNIIVAGVGMWSSNQVNSIVIDLKKGSDSLSLNSIANGGWEAMSEYTTVSTAKNDYDVVHLANGHDITLSGAKKTLVVTAGGAASLNGQVLSWSTPTPPAPAPPAPTPPAPTPPSPSPAPTPSVNWFDSHVIDTALRSLGHNLYTDGLIDRNDMISLLRNAQDGNVIDSTELTDLRTITSNTSLFGSFDYVWKLSNYVVNANTANAK